MNCLLIDHNRANVLTGLVPEPGLDFMEQIGSALDSPMRV